MPGTFVVSIEPASGGSWQTFLVTVTSIDEYKGTVDLTCSAEHTTCNMGADSVSVPRDGIANATCTVGEVTEADTLTVTGTDGSLSDDATAELTP